MTAASERTFLLACAVAEPGHWAGWNDAVRRLAPPGWREVHSLAVLHGFAGLLARNLRWAGRDAEDYVLATW